MNPVSNVATIANPHPTPIPLRAELPEVSSGSATMTAVPAATATATAAVTAPAARTPMTTVLAWPRFVHGERTTVHLLANECGDRGLRRTIAAPGPKEFRRNSVD